MYKKYCFFREYTSDIVRKCKYYEPDGALYLIADMLNQIRKEIGMYNLGIPLKFKSIAFFTNDIYFNPNANFKWWKSKISIFLVKFELFLYKIEELTIIKIFFTILTTPIKLVKLLFKYLFFIPLGKICIKIQKIRKNN